MGLVPGGVPPLRWPAFPLEGLRYSHVLQRTSRLAGVRSPTTAPQHTAGISPRRSELVDGDHRPRIRRMLYVPSPGSQRSPFWGPLCHHAERSEFRSAAEKVRRIVKRARLPAQKGLFNPRHLPGTAQMTGTRAQAEAGSGRESRITKAADSSDEQLDVEKSGYRSAIPRRFRWDHAVVGPQPAASFRSDWDTATAARYRMCVTWVSDPALFPVIPDSCRIRSPLDVDHPMTLHRHEPAAGREP